jgi:hypothetical protein
MVITAEQGDLTDGEKALLDLLKKELRRDLRTAAKQGTRRSSQP